jgi:hypothetical protein
LLEHAVAEADEVRNRVECHRPHAPPVYQAQLEGVCLQALEQPRGHCQPARGAARAHPAPKQPRARRASRRGRCSPRSMRALGR